MNDQNSTMDVYEKYLYHTRKVSHYAFWAVYMPAFALCIPAIVLLFLRKDSLLGLFLLVVGLLVACVVGVKYDSFALSYLAGHILAMINAAWKIPYEDNVCKLTLIEGPIIQKLTWITAKVSYGGFWLDVDLKVLAMSKGARGVMLSGPKGFGSWNGSFATAMHQLDSKMDAAHHVYITTVSSRSS